MPHPQCTIEDDLRRWALLCPLLSDPVHSYADVTIEIRNGRVVRYHVHRTATIVTPGHDPGRQSERPNAASQ